MAWTPHLTPRSRVIVDNDFSGDPDDLFALAHQVLSPSTSVRGVIGSHLAPGDHFDPSNRQADNAAEVATDLLRILGRSEVPVVTGSNVALDRTPAGMPSAAARFIVDEALRAGEDLPLLATFGGGLTELASAWLLDPSIESKLTLVWIGGEEYPETAEAPFGARGAEYNLNIDIPAAQVIFNESAIPIIQIPRDAYRQCIVSMTELSHELTASGRLGDFLGSALDRVFQRNESAGHRMGETYVMGDNPLVLASALQTPWQPGIASSSTYRRPAPYITDAGGYAERVVRRPRDIRVCSRVDTRLIFADMFAKFRMFASGGDSLRIPATIAEGRVG